MAKQVKNLPQDKPFLLIEGTSADFLTATGMGTKYPYICPRCGIPVMHTTRVIYVAVENTVMCVRCAERWLNVARWYKEEVEKEKDYFDIMVQKLKDSKLWEE